MLNPDNVLNISCFNTSFVSFLLNKLHLQQRKHRSDVGIFWDLRAISDSIKYPHKDLNFSVQLGLQLVDVARSLNKNSEMDILMKTFCPVSVISTRDNNVLEELGFEVNNNRER